jgi:REP element-mobilizing transposase RayT
MPRKNTLRLDIPNSFFHVYNRGVARSEIFKSDDDYRYFEYLLERQLSKTPVKNKDGREYPNFDGKISIHSYCLMSNHFHLLIKQNNQGDIKRFLTSLITSYSMYLNKKYSRKGPVFESTYKAILVEKDEYLTHLSRYIHLNPLGFRSWEYSSYNDYLYTPKDWVETSFILGMFRTKKHYLAFVDDYQEKSSQEDDLSEIFGDA